MAASLGIDFGTNSVRALVVDCENGRELGVGLFNYPSGEQGVLLDKKDHHLARQSPADYLQGLEKSVLAALEAARQTPNFSAELIIGIGVDTTGSSPMPVDANNKPLALSNLWKDHLAAQCWLWKDHTSHVEAAEITRLCLEHRPHFLAKCGNAYSSEWWWSKIWCCLKVAPEVFSAAFSWVELADYIPSVLAGISDPQKIKRGVCAAGHKALYAVDWGGLPDKDFLRLLDPRLADLRDRLYKKAYDATEPAGYLCSAWAKTLGLPEGIPIAIGEFDVHYGAIGCGIQEGVLVKAIGTSTCDCAVISAQNKVAEIPGICGIVSGSILPGYFGIEAGQSAVGDIFKWWVEIVCQGDAALHAKLSQEAEKCIAGESGLLALDWNNGNRTILVDPMLTGLLVGQSLYTTRAEIYRSLIEATAFGARTIIERMEDYGLSIKKIVCCGGIAEKNSLLMQIYADVTGREMLIAGSSQACALGSAISAAVLAGKKRGGYASFPEAQKSMTSLQSRSYLPDQQAHQVYNEIYSLYRQLHDVFGGVDKNANLGTIMKQLIHIKETQKLASSF